MSNWCSNELTIEGEDLSAFDKAFYGKPADWTLSEIEKKFMPKTDTELEDSYCLNALYPVPQEVLDLGYSRMDKYTGEDSPFATIDRLFNPNGYKDGYDWCISHWGVKWDLDYVEKEALSAKLVYRFITPWGPPTRAFSKIAADWSDLKFTLKYEEESMDISGVVVFSNGVKVSDTDEN